MTFTDKELKFDLLVRIEDAIKLPFVSLRMHSSTNAEAESVAMHYVVLDQLTDSVAEVRRRSDLLCDLEDEGWIMAEYPADGDLEVEDYMEFFESDVYKEFLALVANGAKRPEFIYDEAVVVKGIFTLDVDEAGSPKSKPHSHSHGHSHGEGCGCGGHGHHHHDGGCCGNHKH